MEISDNSEMKVLQKCLHPKTQKAEEPSQIRGTKEIWNVCMCDSRLDPRLGKKKLQKKFGYLVKFKWTGWIKY